MNLQQNLDNNSDAASDDDISDSDDEFEEHHQDELDRIVPLQTPRLVYELLYIYTFLQNN